MGKLRRFEEAEQLSMEELLAEVGCEVRVGDVVGHRDNKSFEGVVVGVSGDLARVKVRRWCGRLPVGPVTVRVERLVVR